MLTYPQVLKSHGFRRCKSYAKGVGCYITEDGRRYAEVYTETWGRWAWMIGDGLPSDPGYPGGKAYHEPHRMNEALSK